MFSGQNGKASNGVFGTAPSPAGPGGGIKVKIKRTGSTDSRGKDAAGSNAASSDLKAGSGKELHEIVPNGSSNKSTSSASSGGGKKGLKLNVGMTASNNENTPSLLSDNHSNSNSQVNHVGLATKNSLSSSLADSPMSSSLAGSSASSSPVVQDREPPPPNFSLPSAAVAAAAAAAAASNSKSTDGSGGGNGGVLKRHLLGGQNSSDSSPAKKSKVSQSTLFPIFHLTVTILKGERRKGRNRLYATQLRLFSFFPFFC